MRRIRLGIALGADRLVARAATSVLPGDAWSAAVDGAPDADGRWPALDAAMRALRAKLPSDARVVASVSVLPPLVQLRALALPPLRPEERRRALTRDAARWFIGAREPQVVDATPSAPGHVVAAALASRYAEAIVQAAEAAGIVIRSVQPAPWPWVALLDRAQRDATHAIVIPDGAGVVVTRLARGVITEVRRVRGGADVVPQVGTLLDDAGVHGAAGVVIGRGALAERLTTELGLRGIERQEESGTLAAAMAGRTRGPELLPERARMGQRATASRVARRLAVVAAVLLLAAAGVQLWGVERQLATVKRDRAAIHPQVERAIATRDSATAIEAQYSAVAMATRAAPRWTAVLVDLTRSLPDDAHLVSFTAAGDSVTLVGEAAHAADVFDALRHEPRVAGVRADAPIRREFTPDRSPVERFSVVARLSPDGLTAMPTARARDTEGAP